MRISRASKACAISQKPGADARPADGFRAARLIRTFMAGNGKGADFAPYLETPRSQYKTKRNFMQRLDGIESAKEHSHVVIKRGK